MAFTCYSHLKTPASEQFQGTCITQLCSQLRLLWAGEERGSALPVGDLPGGCLTSSWLEGTLPVMSGIFYPETHFLQLDSILVVDPPCAKHCACAEMSRNRDVAGDPGGPWERGPEKAAVVTLRAPALLPGGSQLVWGLWGLSPRALPSCCYSWSMAWRRPRFPRGPVCPGLVLQLARGGPRIHTLHTEGLLSHRPRVSGARVTPGSQAAGRPYLAM